METPINTKKFGRAAGFSMVEMLMAAFILAVGLLGLGMLHLAATKANTSSRSYGKAVLLSERILDEINTEARLTLQWARQQTSTSLGTMVYMPPANADSEERLYYYDIEGLKLGAATGAYYTVQVHSERRFPAASSDMQGGIQAYTVTVTFKEAVDPKDATKFITRNVKLSREIAYARLA